MADSVTFVGEIADQQFKQWYEGHQAAFYLNIKGRKAMLHTTACSHLGDAEGVNSVRNPKVCSSRAEDLENWAKDNNKAFETCSDCLK
jgi:hypothetical protein